MTGDVINIEWRGNSAQLQKDLDTTNARAKELKKTITEIEKDGGKGSENWQKYKNELKATEEQAKKLSKELKTMDVSAMSMRQLELHAKDLAKEMKNADRTSQDYVKNAKRLGEVERELEKAKKQAAALKAEGDDLGKPGLWSKITSGVKGVGTAFQAIMALQIIQWLWNIGKEIFTTTAGFEKYEKVLTTALGGQKEAKQSMEALKKMAKETSFGVDELTDGYVKMVNRGLRPSQKEMVALADLAASQGKTFDQLVEAVLDAQTGEFERLKEFGVKARKEGDNVSLSFKGQTQVVKNNEEAIYQAMIAMGTMTGVAGQNAQMMETLGGKASNLGDVMDALMVAIGDRLSPIFKFFLDLIADSAEYFVDVINASDPVLQVFQDLFNAIGDLAGSFINIFSNVFPKFNTGGNLLTTVMQGVAFVFRAALAPTQLFIGVLADVFQAIGGIVQGGKALIQVFAGDFSGAAESFERSKTSFSSVGTHAAASFDKIKKGWTDAFVTQPKNDIPEAVFAAKTAEQGRQDAVTDTQKKEQGKRAKEREKGENKLNEMIKQLDAEHNQVTANNAIQTEEYKIQEKRRKRLKEINDSAADEKTKEAARILVNRNADAEIVALREKDNKKALELLSAMEAEYVQKSTNDALLAEESKIGQLKIKRLKEIEDSAADELVKTQLIKAINDAADASLTKVREDNRLKRAKEEEAAAAKRLETENFILDKQRTAEMAMFDWQEMQARGNSEKIAAIKKNRVDADLKLTHQRLEAEMAIEQQKAIALTHDAEQLAIALDAIDAKFHNQGLAATKKAADDKLAIDKDLYEKKAANRKAYSDLFYSLLDGDVSGAVSAARLILGANKAAMSEETKALIEKFEQGAQLAQQGVNFLNDLAQKKADKAIAEAFRERDEKVAILQREIALTELMQTTASNYVVKLKEEEEGRLNGIAEGITTNTESELGRRMAITKMHSEELKALKAAEEAEMLELQKTGSEAEIAQLRKEYSEKITLAEEAMLVAVDNQNKLVDLQKVLTTETSTEEQKRAAVHEGYSILLQNLKEAEEAKIVALKKLASEAKTAYEKQSVEAQITMAERERDAKIRVMEEERDKKKQTLDNLLELEIQLTENTIGELDKRAITSKFYSDQLQTLKAAEEAKISEMQHMANLAKTEDEKLAIEAKIELAKQESNEKIRLAELEMNRSIADNQKLTDLQRVLSSETSTEEQKRSAVQESYSILLQSMKTAEEAKIVDLHKQANEAKTADEKAATEAKIAMAEKEKVAKIKLMEEERDRKTETLNDLDLVTKQLSEKQLSDAKKATDKQIAMAEMEADKKADFKIDLEETIAAENRKARVIEIAEKRKAFAAEKKARIASALISGASAVLSALATPPIFVGIVMAAIAAGLTGIQVAKIKNQPEPQFSHGGTLGHVPQGGRHGSSYGIGGIGLIDRASGRDVGEMEGGEAIISVAQTDANWPLIQQMFANARTPGKQNKPIIPHPATPMAFRDGGKFESPYFEQGMYLFGSKKKKAQAAAAAAEAEAAAMTTDMSGMDGEVSFDAGAISGSGDGGDGGASTAESKAAYEESKKQGEKQLVLQQETVDLLSDLKGEIVTMKSELRSAVNSVDNTTGSVRDAIYNTNTQSKFDALIGAISSMSA